MKIIGKNSASQLLTYNHPIIVIDYSVNDKNLFIKFWGCIKKSSVFNLLGKGKYEISLWRTKGVQFTVKIQQKKHIKIIIYVLFFLKKVLILSINQ